MASIDHTHVLLTIGRTFSTGGPSILTPAAAARREAAFMAWKADVERQIRALRAEAARIRAAASDC